MASTANPQSPILASWKISEVLQRYPQLLEVLIVLNPAFGHLRHPIVRRVQTRLVTVAQAARIAGLEPAALVQSLNQAVGLASLEGETMAATEQQASAALPSRFEMAPVAVELDVRPYQQRGEEPFGAIMAAAARVPAGQRLCLRNTFEPLPLYGVLGKRGFQHWARQLGPDDWEIFFLKSEPGEAPVGGQESPSTASSQPPLPRPSAAASAAGWESPSAVVTIDVSDLVPPEPMVRILEAMERLEAGEALLVHHVRRPVYLYPRLDALGYVHETRDLAPGHVEILVRKPTGG